MKTITIGKLNCDIVIQNDYVSRKHAEISLADGQYVYCDMSTNGTTINGRVYHNEKVVIVPGTPVYLANKVPLPWSQVLMLLPNTSMQVNGGGPGGGYGTCVMTPPPAYNAHDAHDAHDESIEAVWGVLSFVFPFIGVILYFIWKDTANYKAKQAIKIAGISVAIDFGIGFLIGLAAAL